MIGAVARRGAAAHRNGRVTRMRGAIRVLPKQAIPLYAGLRSNSIAKRNPSFFVHWARLGHATVG